MNSYCFLYNQGLWTICYIFWINSCVTDEFVMGIHYYILIAYGLVVNNLSFRGLKKGSIMYILISESLHLTSNRSLFQILHLTSLMFCILCRLLCSCLALHFCSLFQPLHPQLGPASSSSCHNRWRGKVRLFLRKCFFFCFNLILLLI